MSEIVIVYSYEKAPLFQEYRTYLIVFVSAVYWTILDLLPHPSHRPKKKEEGNRSEKVEEDKSLEHKIVSSRILASSKALKIYDQGLASIHWTIYKLVFTNLWIHAFFKATSVVKFNHKKICIHF